MKRKRRREVGRGEKESKNEEEGKEVRGGKRREESGEGKREGRRERRSGEGGREEGR